MNSISFQSKDIPYGNNHIHALILNKLREEFESFEREINVKVQKDFDTNSCKDIEEKKKEFIMIAKDVGLTNIDKIDDYFKTNPIIALESLYVDHAKEDIKMSILKRSCFFISNDEINKQFVDKYKFKIGILIESDWYLNIDQKNCIRQKYKDGDYKLPKLNDDIMDLMLTLENSSFKNDDSDHLLLFKSKLSEKLLLQKERDSIYLQSLQIKFVQPNSFKRFINLEYLWLCDNELSKIVTGTFDNLPKLIRIYLNSNELESIEEGAFKRLPSLKELILCKNKINKITGGVFIDLPELKLIDLEENQIESLEKSAFENLTGLNCILLAKNRISNIIPGIFNNLPELKIIGLRGNQFGSLQSPEMEPFQNLPSLHLIDCD